MSQSEETSRPRLLLARIKRIVKQDPDIAMISNSSVQALAAATQVFVGHFTEQAYFAAQASGRTRLTYNDFAAVVAQQDEMEFLSSIVPRTMSFKEIRDRRARMGLESTGSRVFVKQPELLEGSDSEEEVPGTQPDETMPDETLPEEDTIEEDTTVGEVTEDMETDS